MREITGPQVLESASTFALVRAAQPAAMDTILRLAARPTYITPNGAVIRIPLTTEPRVALGPSEVWAGNGITGSLAWYDKGGVKNLELVFPDGGAIEARDVDPYVVQDLEGYTGACLRLGVETQEWAVSGEKGEALGVTDLPRPFELRVVVEDRMLGVWRDEFGVESVRVYRLLRP